MAERSDVTVTKIGDKPVVDVDALIKQYGGQPAAQPGAAPVDMMALIQQYGGRSDQDQIPQRQGLDALSQYAGVINRAIAPYATVGIGGTAVGGPLVGAGAVGTLALTDLGSTLANLGLQAAGSERRVPVPSDVIRGGYETLMPSVFRQPETAAQRYTASGAEAATTALSQANALRQLAQTYGPGVTKNVLSMMGRDPAAQTAAGAGGALAQQVAIEESEEGSFLRNPLVLSAVGVLGGMTTGRLSARGPQTVKEFFGKGTPSEEQFYQQAKNQYKALDQAGVVFSANAYNRMLANLKQRLADEGFTDQPAIKAVLTKLDKFANQDRKFTDIDTARSDITKTLIKSQDENVRRLGREISDELDDFVLNASPNDVITGNLPQALSRLTEARRLWGQVSRSEQMSDLLRRAKLSKSPLDTAVRDEFRKFKRNNPRAYNRFGPEEQEFIDRVIDGGKVAETLTDIGEALRVQRSLGGTLYAGVGGLSTPFAAQIGQIDPLTAATIMGGIATTRAAATGTANVLASRRAENAARAMRGFRQAPLAPLALPVGQTAVRPATDFLSQSEMINALAGR
jgi:hypothetical protein